MESVQKQPSQNAPQITIGFLLGWTLLSAILIAIGSWADLDDFTDEITLSISTLIRSYQVVYGITAALVFAAAVQLRKTKHAALYSSKNQPGHWILYALAMDNFFHYLTLLGSLWEQSIYDYASNQTYVLSGFFGIGISVIYALGAMSTKERWWRWYLAAAASVTIVQAAWSLFYAIDADLIPRNVSLVLDNGIKLVSFLLVVYFMMLVTKDLATRRRRDWLHWAAVLAETIFTILPGTYFLLYYSLQ